MQTLGLCYICCQASFSAFSQLISLPGGSIFSSLLGQPVPPPAVGRSDRSTCRELGVSGHQSVAPLVQAEEYSVKLPSIGNKLDIKVADTRGRYFRIRK
jgi:hypothetical protein